MGRKKSPTSKMDAGEKARTPLAQRLFDTITDPVALAGKLGVSPQAVSQYRNGGAQPTLERLCQIADIYGVSVDYLLGRTDIPFTSPDARAACEYTGLSAQSIQILANLRGSFDRYDKLLALDSLIRSNHLKAFLHNLFFVHHYSEKVRRELPQIEKAWNELQKPKSADEKKIDIGRHQKAMKPIEDRDLFQFQTQKVLFQIFKEIEEGADNGSDNKRN